MAYLKIEIPDELECTRCLFKQEGSTYCGLFGNLNCNDDGYTCTKHSECLKQIEAEVGEEIRINSGKQRKCIFHVTTENKQECIFHKFVEISRIIPPSLMKGGHNGGVVSDVFALIELNSGNLLTVGINKITFK